MESGWVVEYEGGSKDIMTEQVFDEHADGIMRKNKKVVCESHYFDIQVAIKRNPDSGVTW